MMMDEAMESARDVLDQQLWDNSYDLERLEYGNRTRGVVTLAIAARVVAAYLREALRPRPMNEAPRLGDEGSDFVLVCRDGEKRPFVGYTYKSRVFCMCPGTLPVDVGHVDDFTGWLPLPELPG